MAKSKIDPKARRLLEVAEKYRRAQPWHDLDDRHPFVVELHDCDESLTAMVLGAAGIEFGLAVLRGPRSYREAIEAATSEDKYAIMGLHSWSLTWSKRHEVEPPFNRVFEQGGLRGNSTQLVPLFYALEPHSNPRPLRAAEVRAFGDLIDAVVQCYKSGRLNPPSPPRNQRRMLRIEVGKGGKLADVSEVRIPEGLFEGSSDVEPVTLARELGNLPKLPIGIAIAACTGPAIQDQSQSTAVLAAVDVNSGAVVGLEVALGDPVDALPSLVAKTFEGSGSSVQIHGRPKTVYFQSRRLFSALSPALAAIDVAAEFEPDAPIFDMLDDLFASMPFGNPTDEPAANLEHPESLEDWRSVEGGVMHAYFSGVLRELDNARRRKRFFGRSDVELPDDSNPGLLDSYCDWLACDCRSGRSGPSYIERMLAQDEFPDPERVILESRRDSVLSLFRVVSTEPGESLIVVDIRTGREYPLADRSLSFSLRPNECLFLRVCPILDWYFPSIAGPALPLARATEILERVESAPTSGLVGDDLRARGDAVGRLWAESAELASFHPNLVNTEGDPLEFIRATYEVGDWPSLEATFDGRDDVTDRHDARSEWTWLDAEDTVLATLSEQAGRLVVETNSGPRFDRAQDWLEQISGVRLVERSMSTPDEMLSSGAPLGAGPLGAGPSGLSITELDPDQVAVVAPFLERQILGWLDEEIPALGGKTPRQAVRTKAGRKKVSQLIHSMPNPVIVAQDDLIDFEALRARMLAELGLD